MAKSKQPIKFWSKEHTGPLTIADMSDLVTRDDVGATKSLVTSVSVAAGDDSNSANITLSVVDITTPDSPSESNKVITIQGNEDTKVSVSGDVISIDSDQSAALDKKVDKLTEQDEDRIYLHTSTGAESSLPVSDLVSKTEIVDDLTTGGSDKVLSAEQGKVLNEKIEKLSPFEVGMMIGYPIGGTQTNAPDKWLKCDGTQVDKTTYEDLYNFLKLLSVDGATCPYGESGSNFTLPTADNMIIYAGV